MYFPPNFSLQEAFLNQVEAHEDIFPAYTTYYLIIHHVFCGVKKRHADIGASPNFEKWVHTAATQLPPLCLLDAKCATVFDFQTFKT